MKDLLFAISTFALLCATASAQVHFNPPAAVDPQPNDIVIRRNQIRQTVTCKGNAVYVQGQENQIEVNGACTFVRIQGNRNLVVVNQATDIPVEGNENRIYFNDPNTRISARGEHNHFERKKKGLMPLK